MPTRKEQRRFQLHRDTDFTGVSGTGVVADGMQYLHRWELMFPDGDVVFETGWCRVTWRGEHSSIVLWEGIDHVLAVHGHDGATRVVWLDDEEGEGS